MAATLTEEGLRIVSGGTDNHLMLIDLTPNDLTGKDVEEALDRANITVNKNGIPFDTQGPQITSGIRIGTPALTTRGMKEDEMRQVGRLICRIVKNMGDEAVISQVKEEVTALCARYPLYSQRIADYEKNL